MRMMNSSSKEVLASTKFKIDKNAEHVIKYHWMCIFYVRIIYSNSFRFQ